MKTVYGSPLELLRAPDAEGWGIFKRLTDGAVREWHVTEIVPETDAEWDLLFKTPIELPE